MGRCRVLCRRGVDSDSHFAGDRTIQMGWKEVAMRKANHTFTCDRCGLIDTYEGHMSSVLHAHNTQGWRRIVVGSYVYNESTGGIRTGGPMHRDLCRMCYTDLIAFIELDKPDHSTVQ